ncbi:metal-dependent transcriptional regulator [Halomarina halobia]|uniref:Metal-dependent transcriptional regulator n=1 Tax=Halomarina halobia TaxID=3033386 RepID=A0ABD6AD33_9EURY|nr:metal-dependent transcriptional regulator [Halomarina sp. PSR21]
MASTSDRPADPSDTARSERPVERRPGRYLLAVYWLGRIDGARVRTGAVGDYLGVHPASVTEMFSKLAAAALLDYEKHRGVELTDRGERAAGELAWRQCVVRSFFATELDAAIGDDDAYLIGYTLPERSVARLRTRIERPCERSCPELPARAEHCLVGSRIEC